MVKQKIIKSPINYMGSKRRLLPQLLPELQQDNIDTFFDLFAGAGNVSLNVKAQFHVWNDLSTPLIQMFRDLSTLNSLQFEALKSMSLNLTSKDEFLKLRSDYNSGYFECDFDKSISLYLLIIASFNGLPRFNKAFEYNMPYANSERVNKRYLENKLKILGDFIKVIKNGSYGFTSKSYDKVINLNTVHDNDLVYMDPPYSLTTATYNDGKRGLNWTKEDDVKLVDYFRDLTQAGIKTAMSNVLSHRGKENKVLAEFIKANPDLKIVHFNMDYSNSTYHTKSGKSDEILIKNY